MNTPVHLLLVCYLSRASRCKAVECEWNVPSAEDYEEAVATDAQTSLLQSSFSVTTGPEVVVHRHQFHEKSATKNATILSQMSTHRVSRVNMDLSYTIWVSVGLSSIVVCLAIYCISQVSLLSNDGPCGGSLASSGSAGKSRSIADTIGACEIETRKNENLEEDIYALAISLLVRDAQCLARGAGNPTLRALRLCLKLALVLFAIFVQAALVTMIKWYVTPQAVAGIRDAYDQYEFQMYGSDESHTYLTRNGKHRGLPKYFNASHFADLDDDLKGSVCNIPFSEQSFFMLVLFIWSLTCVAQIKKCVELFCTFMYATPTTYTMEDALQYEDSKFGEDGVRESVITGLTPWLKALIGAFILFPWFSIVCFLMWLGSRWLAATNDFGNLVSNAVALEFILCFKDLAYQVVPERSKRDLRHTEVLPLNEKEPEGWCVFLGSFLWGVAAFVWVVLYIHHFQLVLPGYNWDVHEVCQSWLKGLLAVPA